MKHFLTVVAIAMAMPCAAQLSSGAPTTEESLRDKLQIAELSQQVAYYKTALNLSKALRSNTFEDLSLAIKTVRGLRKDGTIVIEFEYQNTSQRQRGSLQTERAVLVDPQGNQYQTSQVMLHTDGRVHTRDLVPKVPYRGGLVFRKTGVEFPMIRALILYFYPEDNISNPQPVVFESIPIVWE